MFQQKVLTSEFLTEDNCLAKTKRRLDFLVYHVVSFNICTDLFSLIIKSQADIFP